MVTPYSEFLARKRRRVQPTGRPTTPDDVHPHLHPWQRDIVAWAVRQGRAGLWADTGLGKTLMQVEWARLSGHRALIVAPLAVCEQTVREAAKVGVDVAYVRGDYPHDDRPIRITNYELACRFDPTPLDAVVLDEASILKNHAGRTRDALITHFRDVRHKLACTATPAPNDAEELTNQAEFLGVATRKEMLAAYFVHDQGKGWRIKGHARGPLFAWMSTWALAVRKPSDLGYPDDGYNLPALATHVHGLQVAAQPEGELFAVDLGGVGGRQKIRRATLDARVQKTAELVAAEPDQPWLIWAGLNDEADALERLIPGAVNVPGTWDPDTKAAALLAFADGEIPALITKTSVAGFGMNWQHCARVAFCGLSDSWESYYQAIRRCWRYGQTRPVHVHIVLSELETRIAANVARKERAATQLAADLAAHMSTQIRKDAA